MRHACSLALDPGMIGNLYIITRGPMVRDRRPRSPIQTGSRRWCLATIATCTVLTSGGVGAQQTPEQRALIEEGRKLFFEETFNGNGRTCGTCHPATNNFTIDPAFVRTLPRSDPLFIARRTPELSELEIQQFLRQGTILENLDSFANPGVMRGVPHTLALRESTPTNRTGWSGDGAPGDGSIRSFATGAVTQHFPRTLNRVPGVDFRLPTEHELDAMAAFQLSLGRQEAPPPIAALVFDDPTVDEGRDLFIESTARDGNPRGCGGCHVNGGTNNGARATGVNKLPSGPACELNVGRGVPGDGGFSSGPIFTMTHKQLCQKGNKNTAIVFRGDETFDVPPVIEAADTPPFFHNNAIAKLEDAIAFYTTDTFNNSIAGGGRAFVLDRPEINAIGAFLRALNAVENIRSSNAYAQRSIDPDELAPKGELKELAIAETTDAIEVLTKGPIKLYPVAVAALKDARTALKRNDIDEAIALQEAARADIVVAGP
jgi:cytochrome c peroxidase